MKGVRQFFSFQLKQRIILMPFQLTKMFKLTWKVFFFPDVFFLYCVKCLFFRCFFRIHLRDACHIGDVCGLFQNSFEI